MLARPGSPDRAATSVRAGPGDRARRLGVAREVTHRYVDPLAQVWLGAAHRIGLRVERTRDAYASTDGRGQAR